jgi:hypothetical protein
MAASPSQAAYFNPRPAGTVVTVEKTGKGLKLQLLLAVGLLIFGIVRLVNMVTTKGDELQGVIAGLCIVFSIVWLIVIKIKTWWRHG